MVQMIYGIQDNIVYSNSIAIVFNNIIHSFRTEAGGYAFFQACNIATINNRYDSRLKSFMWIPNGVAKR